MALFLFIFKLILHQIGKHKVLFPQLAFFGRGGQACAADPDTVPVRAAASDDGVSAEQRKYPDAAPGLLVPVVLRAARASFEHKRSHLISALSAYFTGFSGCGRPDDGLARPVEQA